MGYSPWNCKESDTTEHAHARTHTHTHTHTEFSVWVIYSSIKAWQKYFKISDFSHKVKMKTGGICFLFVFCFERQKKNIFSLVVDVYR